MQIIKVHIFSDHPSDLAAFSMALKAVLAQTDALDYLLQLVSTCNDSQVSFFIREPLWNPAITVQLIQTVISIFA